MSFSNSLPPRSGSPTGNPVFRATSASAAAASASVNEPVFRLIFAAVSAGLFALHSGAGPIAAIAVGFVVGVLALALGNAVFTLVPSSVVRGLVALLFTAPAPSRDHGLAALAVPSDG